MMRQYGAQRSQGGHNPLRVGTIPVGANFYLQDESWWRDRYRGQPVCRSPWIVESFLNGLIQASRRSPETSRWEDTFASGRSDMAVVRSLRDGRQQPIAVRMLVLHENEGLTAQMVVNPTLPDLRFYKIAHHRSSKEKCPCPTRPHPQRRALRKTASCKPVDAMSSSNSLPLLSIV